MIESLVIHPHELSALRILMDVPTHEPVFAFEFTPLAAMHKQLKDFRGLMLFGNYPETDDPPWVAIGLEHPDGLNVPGRQHKPEPGDRITRVECRL